MKAAKDAVTNYPIRAVERVCDILDVLQRSREGATLADVAEVTALPKSSAYRYLAALESRRYVERDVALGLYRLGLAFRPQHTRQVDALVNLARPHLERLRDKLGETTNMGLLDGAEVVHAVVVESHEMMRLAARVGDRGALHATALGKAIVAELPEERVRALLSAQPLQRYTPATITTVERYLEELETVRREGYGLDDCENQPDGRCVAVSLQGLPFLCGISVSAPARRLPPDKVEATARALRRVAMRLVRDFHAAG
ncbi:IclR family transcriptional regulator [Dactylosporangium fulvum]|uniref:IclR family transcriptional regulator n=1 Tax=Dactylosporangium fulvum TaxID=53359 RepID=A0ABY5VS66_9ACTN|nr:IclR family transcriptional regulator [Dactylosporangium fulvum]UWP79989.1 IclR family transcriptional regulator [Dactylosporangium fulvum]